MTSALWITEADVVGLMGMSQAIEALEGGLVLLADGLAKNMGKTHTAWGNGDTLHAIGAVLPSAALVGTKTWAHTEGGASPLLVMYDAHDGSLVAIVEAFALGQLRTGAMTAVATKYLSDKGARELGMIGSGKQSVAQVAAVAAVRPLERVRVYSPTLEHRERFAQRLRETFPFEVVVARSIREAVYEVPIVTLATRATQPFLFSRDLAPGTHLNAVGAIVPSRIEFSIELFPRANRVVVDDCEAVRRLSREFIEYYGARENWDTITPIADVVTDHFDRDPAADLTIFKAMGMGLSDLALGMHVLRLARERGIGREFPAPARVPLDFSRTTVTTSS